MRLNSTCAILTLLAAIIFYSASSPAYVNVASKLDDLYRIAIRSPEFKGVSRQGFSNLIKAGKLESIAPIIRSLSKEDRLTVVLEIAEQRQMVTTTQLPRLAAKYTTLDGGDELLLQVVEHGDTRLFSIAPKYGSRLMEIERSSRGSGVEIIDALGDQGWMVTHSLSTQQIEQFARHAKGIASIEGPAKAKVLEAISEMPARALTYLDENSGILYKTAGVAGFLVFTDNASQPTTTKITKPDGTVIETTKGIASELLGSLSGYLHWAAWIGLAGLCGWIVIKLRGSYSKTSQRKEHV